MGTKSKILVNVNYTLLSKFKDLNSNLYLMKNNNNDLFFNQAKLIFV